MGVNMTEQFMQRAREIARQVVSGTADPNRSCILLAELCRANNWPETLVAFHALAHEQTGHEQFGFDAENTAPLIVDACRALLQGADQ